MLTKEELNIVIEKEKKRRRRERVLILSIFVFLVFITLLEIRLSNFGDKISMVNSFVFYGFKNFSMILVLVLLFLVTRNIIKTYLEHKKTVPGAKLRTKLVIVFIGFTVVPMTILFISSAYFIESSFDRWFNIRIERTFKESMDVANYVYKNKEELVLRMAKNLRTFLVKEKLFRKSKSEYLKKVLKDYLITDQDIDAVELFIGKSSLSYGSKIYNNIVGPFRDYSRVGFNGEERIIIEHLGEGDIIRGILPVKGNNGVFAVIVISKFLPLRLAKKLEEVRAYYNDYKSIEPIKKPLKSNYFTVFILMTLMILFAASWFGIYLSKQISTPISELVEGTEKIANGNYDVNIAYSSDDEIGKLVKSFNKMATDIKSAKDKLYETYGSLKNSNLMLKEKQEYIEIVLRNVSTGVMALDRKNVVTTINDYAQKLLGVDATDVLGKRYNEFLEDVTFKERIRDIIEEMSRKSLGTIEENVAGKFNGRELFLRINITLLKNIYNKYMGVVVVFDDLSELQKIHRLAAWREVARRIAHEIKNPLTPIQLSAQRLNKKYIEMFTEGSKEREIFSNCTTMIIDQVGSIKEMVNEFATFARMPASNPKLCSLDKIIKDAIKLYSQSSNMVNIEYHNFSSVDDLYLDKGQMKRVFINLIDNSITALKTTPDPEIRIVVSDNKVLEMVTIEVIDNGPGISEKFMTRLFEPYFSTKGSDGTGLGLTIAKQIINDHSGYIRASSSNNNGSRFLIEIPCQNYKKINLTPHKEATT